jgi:microcystin-dependent protein
MSEPFLAEIRIFPYNFAPLNWAFCDGQIMPISQNTALFSLLGTNYGGNGTTNFALPNIQGRCVVGVGQGPSTSDYAVGEEGGVENVTLSSQQGAAHTHGAKSLNPFGGNASDNTPSPTEALAKSVNGQFYAATVGTASVMNLQTLSPAGGVSAPVPHENRMPYLTLSYCIALQGVFPQRP